MMNLIKLQAAIVTLVCFGSASAVFGDHVNWSSDIEASLKRANESGRLVLMKFTADWCGPCKKMERETFSQPEMSAFVNQQFVPVLVNADKHKELMQHLKITSIPTLLVVSPDMVILNRMNGFQTQAQLHPKLQNDITKYVEVNQQPPVVTASTASTPQPTMTQQPPVAQQPPIGQQPMVATLPTSSRSNPFAPASMEKQEPAVYELPAFEGFCLPSVQESRSLVSGRPEFQLKYHGKTLYFLDAEQMQKFQANPDKYFPMNDGACAVTLVETNTELEGKLEYAAMFRGRLWFASSPENMQKFVKSPAAYANALTEK